MKIVSVEQAQISLNGDWKITLHPPDNFWINEVLPDGWDTIEVPGELFASGFQVEYDRPFVYKTQISVPADYAGQRILLHFEAVYNHAKVWVNGKAIAEHQGGFTPWDADITDVVNPGEPAWLTVQVTALTREISFGGKALRNIGGISREVELRARPKTFMDGLIVSTKFDGEYRDATLRIAGTVTSPDASCEAVFRLFDPQGQEVGAASRKALIQTNMVVELPASAPAQWSAEHPNLYRLQVELQRNGKTYASYSKRIGFRELAFDDKKNLLVNGRIVKLRGINRHISDPVRGRVTTPEYDRLDAERIKEANMNFVRTSHYPPGARFLDFCDEIGLYVTVESAVVDVGKKNRPSAGMQDDPKYTKHFISQLREMMDSHGSHPSAIIWSICNESLYGPNFKASYDYVKQKDPSRPVIGSYQVVRDEKNESYDIKSGHYPLWNSDFSEGTMPTIYDEWIHILGHTAVLWYHDPNGRDYWGRSLDKAWSNLFPADGSIGAAIWQYVDDVTYLPSPTGKGARGPSRFLLPEQVRFATPQDPSGNVFGTGHWGMVDEWRRKKPEFWNIQKAYSPVRILDCTVRSFEPGKPLLIPVYNRFDHTDLKEIMMTVEYGGKTASVPCTALAPHAKGDLTIPAMEWKNGTSAVLKFHDAAERLIDAYTIQLGEAIPVEPKPKGTGGSVKILDDGTRIAVSAGSVRYDFDKTSGMLERVTCAGVEYPIRGPFMHMFQWIENRARGGFVSDTVHDPDPDVWKCQEISAVEKDGAGILTLKGSYEDVSAEYVFNFRADGRCEVNYSFKNLPVLTIPADAVTKNKAQMLEFGIKFQIGDQFDELAWKRNGYWSWYPDGHLGALEGRVAVFSDQKPVWRQKPDYPWELDVHDFIHQGWKVPEGPLLPNIVRAAKMNVYEYELIDKDAGVSLAVIGNGEGHCRLMKQSDQHYYLQLLDTLDYALRWGNYSANYPVTSDRNGTVRLEIKKQM